jgi:hypothetical protein
MLHDGDYTFVMISNGKEFVSTQTGIAPLLSILKNSPELMKGASAADKVIGKAAALLLLYGEVREIYADTVSKHALSLLSQAGVTLHYGETAPFIMNKNGTGICPMEQRVLEISDPVICYEVLSNL